MSDPTSQTPTGTQIPFPMNTNTDDKPKPLAFGWTGIDLDGTLAHYDGWKGPDHIGAPVDRMMRRVHKMIADGVRVKIFTARAGDPDQKLVVQDWLQRHGLGGLEVTNVKDFQMVKLYDDRAVYVFPNEGVTHDEHMGAFQAAFLEVATALDVKVQSGMQFGAVAEACAVRARACAPKADAAETALALVDSALDALRCKSPEIGHAQQLLSRAMHNLETLAGKRT